MPTTDLTDAEINARLAELLGLRLSVNTDDAHEVGQAVMSAFRFNVPMGELQKQGYDWNGEEQEIVFGGSKWGYRGVNNNNGYGVFLWDCRDGQPWQSDIEAHVAAYRRPPPNWAGDLATAFTLGEEMRKRGLDYAYAYHVMRLMGDALEADSLNCLTTFDLMHATPRQRAEAAIRVLEGN